MNTYSRIRAWAGGRNFRLPPSALLCGALLAPMGVAVEIPADSLSTLPPDSLSITNPPKNTFERITRFTFAGGSGTYGRTVHAERTIPLGIIDCYGVPIDAGTTHVDANFRFKDSFQDRGGELDMQVTPKAHIGVRGGRIEETATFLGTDLDQATIDTLFASVRAPDSTFTYYYFNPYFAIENEYMGWGLGFVYSDNRLWTDKVREADDFDDASVYPTGHLRLGRLDKAYMKFSMWEGVPLYSGGGRYVAGIGGRPVPWMDLFGGYCTGGPFTSNALVLRGSLDVGRHLTAGVSWRVSENADAVYAPSFTESAASVSLTYKLITH